MLRGQRSDQSVAEQDAEKGADQRRRHLVTDFLGRAAERSHGDHHAEHGGDNAEAGQGIGHRAKRGDRLAGPDDGPPCRLPSSGRGRKPRLPPVIAIRSVSQTKLQRDGPSRNRVSWRTTGFFPALRCPPPARAPFLARLLQEFIHHLESIDVALVAELRGAEDAGETAVICLRVCRGLAMSTVPIAAPPMMISSAGCTSTLCCRVP